MVADALAVEPVSTAEFPANREKNRVFLRIGLFGEALCADTRTHSEAYSRIPYATEQRIHSGEQRTAAQKQEIFLARARTNVE